MLKHSFLGLAIACTVIAPQVVASQSVFSSPVSNIEQAAHWQHEMQQLNQQCDRVNRPMDCNPS